MGEPDGEVLGDAPDKPVRSGSGGERVKMIVIFDPNDELERRCVN